MRNEEAYIDACLASLRAQDYHGTMELLVLDGASTDRSPAIVAELAGGDVRIRLLPNPQRTQAAAMNLGIRQATGEIIVRADAHATYGPAYVSTCVDHLVAGRADTVGGLQRGVGATPFSRALAVALQTPLGAGGAAYRLASEPCYTDTVWLGAWYRQTLVELGGFNEALIANEDYELNCRLRERGGRVLLDPSLESTYYPRTNPGRLWRQYFRYGMAKVRMLHDHPRSLLPRQAIPPLFVLALLIGAALVPITPLPLLGLAGSYLLIVLFASLSASPPVGAAALLLPIVYPIIHFAWGLGFLWGLLRYARR